jgi:PAS domain S-box-containing protein
MASVPPQPKKRRKRHLKDRGEGKALHRLYQEKERTLEALRESEEKYRDLVENINDVIFAHDANGRVMYVNPVVEQLSGYSVTEIIGRSFTEFIYPPDLPALMESFQRTLAGQLEPSEFRVITKSGEIRWARSSSRPIYDGVRVIGVQGVITDITEHKQAEKRTLALFDIAKDISGTLDLHELLDRVQRRAAEVLPCDIVATFVRVPERQTFRMLSQYGVPEELLTDAQSLEFPPNEPFSGRVASGQIVVISDPAEQSERFAALLAYFRIAALVAVPLLVRGRYLGALVACITSSGRKFGQRQIELCDSIARQLAVGIEAAELYRQQQEETEIAAALARSGQELISSLNTPALLERLCHVTAAVLGCDFSHTVLWQPKEAVYRITAGYGNTPEQWEAIRMLKVPQALVADLAVRLEEGELLELEVDADLNPALEAILRQFGTTAVLCSVLRRGKAFIGLQVAGYRGRKGFNVRQKRMARGISQIASLALANAKLLEELEEANRIKDDFVGTMSHELRTPLHIILGYCDLFRDKMFGPLTAEQQEVLQRMGKSARDLLDLINATLDLSRLQNQRVPLSLANMRVTDLLAELASETYQLYQKSTVRVEWQAAPDLPLLQSDPIKLKMVLKNLISNALKFTDAGSVVIKACPEKGGVEFVVSDTGVGIAPEALSIIFEPFRQLDSSTTRRHTGVGLGLYIVRQMLQLLGGTVSVESELEKGSTFRVWIPQKAPLRLNSMPTRQGGES